MNQRLPQRYRHKQENSYKIIQEALRFKEKHGYAYLIIERNTQIVCMYEALWTCQMRVNQSISVHRLSHNYYEIKDVNEFIGKTGKNYG